MAVIALQRGHCFRKTGATGTYKEQEFAAGVGAITADLLRQRGHHVYLLTADEPVPGADVFVALHTDGATNPARRGASVGYPSAEGGRLARAWKAAHQLHGYPGGFLPDNYTDALRGYYGFGRSSARWEFLAEHGTTTNPDDVAWLFANIARCAQAHVDAIGAVVGHPTPVFTPALEEEAVATLSTVTYTRNDGGGTYAAIFFDDGLHLRWVVSPEEVRELQAQGHKVAGEDKNAKGQVVPHTHPVHALSRRRYVGTMPPGWPGKSL